jgi:hypothetical protein
LSRKTSLGFQTARTIIAQGNRHNRTTMKHWERIDPDRKGSSMARAQADARRARSQPSWHNAAIRFPEPNQRTAASEHGTATQLPHSGRQARVPFAVR